MLEETLARLTDGIKPKRCEVAVLVCVPTGWTTFWANRRLPSGVLRLTNMESDYARRILLEFDSYKSYQRQVEAPFLDELRLVELLGAHVCRHASFDSFKLEVGKRTNKVMLLLAHHAEAGIEFWDGPRPWTDVKHTLAKRLEGESLAIVFTVCHSDSWQKEVLPIRRASGEIGAAAWEMPLLESAIFARLLISELDGERTLLDAQDRAVRAFWRPHCEKR